ncbi:MAG: tRNA uridine-5-carboxymethylaminomethyl(34) synthesis GTPase MnmE [Bacteroidales bacterium]|nr:tRNA uridine-5-carboxymethylaminomethyl(34) synthesis GTPase MnmE [Bacteroidales bacterium]
MNTNKIDTICAPATGNGGAINIIRISGSEAITIADSIFIAKKKNFKLSEAKSHTIHFGDIILDNEILDEVLVSVFLGNKSYTGEPSIEISLHASPYILRKTLELLINNGAIMAEPGEFSMRAFLNGKLDLAQAEAVGDIIASSSKMAHNTAMRQLKGQFSNNLKDLRQQLMDFASLIELELDFSEEEVEFADRHQFKLLIDDINIEVTSLINSFKIGNVLKDGIPVAIVGKPNAGKSTLLNTLLQEDKAIISDIAGTTRDVIEDVININGILFRFIDTAGIRDSNDTIEKLGIERTYEKISKANIVLLLLDASEINSIKDIENQVKDARLNMDFNNQELIIVINKIDNSDINIEESDYNIIKISAKSKKISSLEEALANYVQQFNVEDQSIITNARHLLALQKSKESLDSIAEAFTLGIPTDLIAIDVRTCLFHIGSITGQISNDELLGNIFGKFCIGK